MLGGVNGQQSGSVAAHSGETDRSKIGVGSRIRNAVKNVYENFRNFFSKPVPLNEQPMRHVELESALCNLYGPSPGLKTPLALPNGREVSLALISNVEVETANAKETDEATPTYDEVVNSRSSPPPTYDEVNRAQNASGDIKKIPGFQESRSFLKSILEDRDNPGKVQEALEYADKNDISQIFNKFRKEINECDSSEFQKSRDLAFLEEAEEFFESLDEFDVNDNKLNLLFFKTFLYGPKTPQKIMKALKCAREHNISETLNNLRKEIKESDSIEFQKSRDLALLEEAEEFFESLDEFDVDDTQFAKHPGPGYISNTTSGIFGRAK